MKIVVTIKQILDPRGVRVRRDIERIFVNREEYIIGPGSKAALEAALRLQEAGEATIIALSAGEPRADDALREALAMGCDSATLLSDPEFGDLDITGTTRVLAAAIRKLGGADLVLVGRESGDSGAGQIGPRLAGALAYAQVTDVWGMMVEEGYVRASRRWGDGFAAVRVALPAVVSVSPEAYPARLAHGARIMNAYREWEVDVWNAAALGLQASDLTPLLSFCSETFPPPFEVGEVFRGDPGEVAREVVMALRHHRLVG